MEIEIVEDSCNNNKNTNNNITYTNKQKNPEILIQKFDFEYLKDLIEDFSILKKEIDKEKIQNKNSIEYYNILMKEVILNSILLFKNIYDEKNLICLLNRILMNNLSLNEELKLCVIIRTIPQTEMKRLYLMITYFYDIIMNEYNNETDTMYKDKSLSNFSFKNFLFFFPQIFKIIEEINNLFVLVKTDFDPNKASKTKLDFEKENMLIQINYYFSFLCFYSIQKENDMNTLYTINSQLYVRAVKFITNITEINFAIIKKRQKNIDYFFYKSFNPIVAYIKNYDEDLSIEVNILNKDVIDKIQNESCDSTIINHNMNDSNKNIIHRNVSSYYLNNLRKLMYLFFQHCISDKILKIIEAKNISIVNVTKNCLNDVKLKEILENIGSDYIVSILDYSCIDLNLFSNKKNIYLNINKVSNKEKVILYNTIASPIAMKIFLNHIKDCIKNDEFNDLFNITSLNTIIYNREKPVEIIKKDINNIICLLTNTEVNNNDEEGLYYLIEAMNSNPLNVMILLFKIIYFETHEFSDRIKTLNFNRTEMFNIKESLFNKLSLIKFFEIIEQTVFSLSYLINSTANSKDNNDRDIRERSFILIKINILFRLLFSYLTCISEINNSLSQHVFGIYALELIIANGNEQIKNILYHQISFILFHCSYFGCLMMKIKEDLSINSNNNNSCCDMFTCNVEILVRLIDEICNLFPNSLNFYVLNGFKPDYFVDWFKKNKSYHLNYTQVIIFIINKIESSHVINNILEILLNEDFLIGIEVFSLWVSKFPLIKYDNNAMLLLEKTNKNLISNSIINHLNSNIEFYLKSKNTSNNSECINSIDSINKRNDTQEHEFLIFEEWLTYAFQDLLCKNLILLQKTYPKLGVVIEETMKTVVKEFVDDVSLGAYSDNLVKFTTTLDSKYSSFLQIIYDRQLSKIIKFNDCLEGKDSGKLIKINIHNTSINNDI